MTSLKELSYVKLGNSNEKIEIDLFFLLF
jgi:hypothetical protein